MSESSAATAEPEVNVVHEKKKSAKANKPKPKQQPRYNVILWDDQYHTYQYVIRMMQSVFRKTYEDGVKIAEEVDSTGRAIVLTTTKEHAELKRDQIHAFGGDPFSAHGKSKGSMWATIEPMT